jgi:hypothetical protein
MLLLVFPKISDFHEELETARIAVLFPEVEEFLPPL